MSVPTLTLKRLTLRGPHDRDVPWIADFYREPANVRFLPPLDPAHFTHDAIRTGLELRVTRWQASGYGIWTADRTSDGATLGYCGLKLLPDESDVEVLYGFDKRYWGQGYATEAARGALQYGFDVAGLERICAIAIPQNRGSTRVMEKCGMAYHGQRQYYGFEVAFYLIARTDFLKQT